jgi:hypothetical protein
MTFGLKALASAILLSTAAFGLTAEVPDGQFEINAQVMGIDVSDHQPNIDWKSVTAHGVSYAYIKATEGTCKGNDNLVAPNANVLLQPTKVRHSLHSTLAQPRPV